MNNHLKRVTHVSIGIIAGLFLGATLGQLLGAVIGSLIDLFDFNMINTNEIMIGSLFGGLFGLAVGAIVGAGLLSMGKLLFSLTESLRLMTAICAMIGLIVGALTGVFFSTMISVLNFMIFGGSVGVWVGLIAGSFAGVWLPLRANKNEIVATEEEKRADKDYARFLSEKAGRK